MMMPIVRLKDEQMKGLPARKPYDFYQTPIVVAQAAIKNLITVPLRNEGGSNPGWLDPGAGAGVWGMAIKSVYPRSNVTGVELYQEEGPDGSYYDNWYKEDFLQFDRSSHSGRYSYVVGNPPFSLAEEFIEKGLSLLNDGGQLLFLLRLEFLASQDRQRGLFRRTPPERVWVASRRISFQADGKTAPQEYAMMRWTKGLGNSWARLEWWDYLADSQQVNKLRLEDLY